MVANTKISLKVFFKKFSALSETFPKFLAESNFTHPFPLHPFSNPWKHQKTVGFLMFSGGREQVH